MVDSPTPYAVASDYTPAVVPQSMPLPLALGKLVMLLGKQLNRLYQALQNNTFAITAQPNIKGLVGFGSVGWAAGSEYCDRCWSVPMHD